MRKFQNYVVHPIQGPRAENEFVIVRKIICKSKRILEFVIPNNKILLIFPGLINWLCVISVLLPSKISPSSLKTIDDKSVIPGLTESKSFSSKVYRSVSYSFTFGLGLLRHFPLNHIKKLRHFIHLFSN